MTLISSPIFVCFEILLALLVGVLAGRLWSKRVYAAIWREGASWAITSVRSRYVHLPRKLRSILDSTEVQIDSDWRWLPLWKAMSSDIDFTDRAEADPPTDN